MADINIQRKKSAPSPWILVLLAAIVLAAAAYFFLRPNPADETAPAATTAQEGIVDTAVTATSTQLAIDSATAAPDRNSTSSVGESETAASLATQASSDPSAPDYALNGLQKLTGVLVALADRDDLRDPTVIEQRDNLTSATNRLGEPNAGLRAGFVAAASLIRAMQQKAYPELGDVADDLVRQANQLSGRSATAAEQQQNKQFLAQAADAVRVLSEPAK
ncbi:MAG TPA: hypothetical protein VF629_20480 [Hymenobacter sp.]|jgi:hypothetical protein|uniref:hypothetical protein n=1 Tax=Hymenobacter sp. TaxID=1898978 RepID=UPI002ED9147D